MLQPRGVGVFCLTLPGLQLFKLQGQVFQPSHVEISGQAPGGESSLSLLSLPSLPPSLPVPCLDASLRLEPKYNIHSVLVRRGFRTPLHETNSPPHCQVCSVCLLLATKQALFHQERSKKSLALSPDMGTVLLLFAFAPAVYILTCKLARSGGEESA